MLLHCIVKDLVLTLQSQNFLSIHICLDYIACYFAYSVFTQMMMMQSLTLQIYMTFRKSSMSVFQYGIKRFCIKTNTDVIGKIDQDACSSSQSILYWKCQLTSFMNLEFPVVINNLVRRKQSYCRINTVFYYITIVIK